MYIFKGIYKLHVVTSLEDWYVIAFLFGERNEETDIYEGVTPFSPYL